MVSPPADAAQRQVAQVTDETSNITTSLEPVASPPAIAEDGADGDSAPADENDTEAQLAALATGIRDQDDLERDIGRQADQLLLQQSDERDEKRREKTQKEKDRIQSSIRLIELKLTEFGNHATKNRLRAELEHYKGMITSLDKDLEQIQKRVDERHQNENGLDGETLLEEAGNKRLPGESQREFLIRTGKITPFSKMGRQLLKTSSSLGDVLIDAEDEGGEEEMVVEDEEVHNAAGPVSHRNLRAPGFQQEERSAATSVTDDTDGDAALAQRLQDEEFASERPAKRRRVQKARKKRAGSEDATTPASDSDAYVPGMDEKGLAAVGDSGDDAEPDDEDAEGDFPLDTTPGTKRKAKRKQRAILDVKTEQEDLAGIDDGNEHVYQARLHKWVKERSTARWRFKETRTANGTGNDEADDNDPEPDDVDETKDEWLKPHPNRTDSVFEGGYRIPGDIYPSLFDYQKTGVQWLWELFSQHVGGIIGDEMGLGKTIQAISFLAGLHYSGKLTKPVIVVCPATVMKQWVNEFHTWWPPLRVSILHTSGSGMLDVRGESRIEDDLEDDTYTRTSNTSKSHKAAKRVVDRVLRDGHVLVTTYTGLQTYAELLIPTEWGYAVLDEGHKIRNPNTAITIYCKEIRTHNRLILSGTPMQNNLTELWSLFDFVFPMRLGTLVNFKTQFEIPIKQGGYANASNLQVETAMQCAETLKDTISPYLLQRFKIDVAADLPKKSERVLFCKLTKLQRSAYEAFLGGEEMRSIMDGKRQALFGVDILRKICNHPDLVQHKTLSKKADYTYGSGVKSGKMQVVKALLQIWKRNGHKTLLFAQHRIMLDILELFIKKDLAGTNYRRMDGNTSIKDRQNLVDEFNSTPDLHVFLLTTKVGGLGVNLTGADRVIIYDPDWNPSTDVQARERAWRLGQKREVEIYRLMTAGTIEEKIYHRQIFKQFLTNKILRDPKQRQTFQLRDLHDLFTLGGEGETETGILFKGSEVKFTGKADGEADGSTEKTRTGSIVGIHREEDFRGEEEEGAANGPANGEGGTKAKDDRILSSIFARSGVQSALEHDAIINGRSAAVRADPEAITREARKVAAEAAKELQRAGEVARALPAGVPTWTGQFGSAGRTPSPPARRGGGTRGGRGGAGPSSASVLANLQARHIGTSNTTTTSTPPRGRAGTPQHYQGQDFLTLIRDFLRAHGGSAYTQMLVDHFNRYCGTPQRTAEFREMLKVIAELERGPAPAAGRGWGRGRGGEAAGAGAGGRGRWVLRAEYR